MASPQKSPRRSSRLAQKDKHVDDPPRISEQTALSELYSFRRSMSPSPPPMQPPPPPLMDFGDVYYSHEPLVRSVASPRYVSPEPDELLRLQTYMLPRAATPGWDCEGKSRAPTPVYTSPPRDIELMTPPPSPRPAYKRRQTNHPRSSRRSLAGVQ